MTALFSLPDRLRLALISPTRGILGVVDELLAAALVGDVHFVWQDGIARLDLSEDSRPLGLEVPMPKSVARAILARIAVLCNERHPDSVSPWGGRGESMTEAEPARIVRVAFVNTPQEQWLDLSSSHDGDATNSESVSVSNVESVSRVA